MVGERLCKNLANLLRVLEILCTAQILNLCDNKQQPVPLSSIDLNELNYELPPAIHAIPAMVPSPSRNTCSIIQ